MRFTFQHAKHTLLAHFCNVSGAADSVALPLSSLFSLTPRKTIAIDKSDKVRLLIGVIYSESVHVPALTSSGVDKKGSTEGKLCKHN